MPLELTFINDLIANHWGKIVTGLGALLGLSYKTGIEKERYDELVSVVASHSEQLKTLDITCDDRYILLSNMHSNLQLLMRHLQVQPIQSMEKRRKEDNAIE